MSHGNERISPDSLLSEQQLNIIKEISNLKFTQRNNILAHKIQVPEDMHQGDVHFVKIEVELRYPHIKVYQRQYELLFVSNDE